MKITIEYDEHPEPRVPLQVRLRKSLLRVLRRTAEIRRVSISDVVSTIIEQAMVGPFYAAWNIDRSTMDIKKAALEAENLNGSSLLLREVNVLGADDLVVEVFGKRTGTMHTYDGPLSLDQLRRDYDTFRDAGNPNRFFYLKGSGWWRPVRTNIVHPGGHARVVLHRLKDPTME